MDKEDIVTPIPAQCTMAQYEALDDTEFTQYRDFTISDYPTDGANATQMAFALTCNRLFPEGTIIMFSGDTDDNYTKGHCYQIKVTDGVKSWVDITPVSEQTIPLLVGTQEKPINLYSDLEANNFYLIDGYYKQKGHSPFKITEGPVLCKCTRKNSDDNTIQFFNSLFNGSSLIVDTGINCFVSFNNTPFRRAWQNYVSVSYLNGNASSNNINFYAPTTSGTAGQILKSSGANNEPTWIDMPASGTQVKVADTAQTEISFTSDPQTQINGKLNAPETAGTSGQILQSSDDGKTEWVDIPSSEQTIPLLTGTSDNPINLITDLEGGRYYLLTGVIKISATKTISVVDESNNSCQVLVYKASADSSLSSAYFTVTFYGCNYKNDVFVFNSTVYITSIFLGSYTIDNSGVISSYRLNTLFQHYIQLTVGDKTVYYTFTNKRGTAYTESGLLNQIPTVPDNAVIPLTILANGRYSTVNGLIYRDSTRALKVIIHGMYTEDGSTMSYLEINGETATFVSDTVKEV